MTHIYDYENHVDSFLYMWKHTEKNLFYVGLHKGTLNDGYICSSKIMLEDYKKNKEKYKRIILKKGNYEELLKIETKILQKVDAKNNIEYMNMHNGNGEFFLKKHTQETRNKMSMVANGKIKSQRSKSKEEIKKETSEKLRQKRLGMKMSEETKQKHKALYEKKKKHLLKIKKCEHCNKETTLGNYARYHGENCKTIGGKQKEETLLKLKNNYKNTTKNILHDIKHTCTICGKITNIGNITQFHNEKCKGV